MSILVPRMENDFFLCVVSFWGDGIEGIFGRVHSCGASICKSSILSFVRFRARQATTPQDIFDVLRFAGVVAVRYVDVCSIDGGF